MGKYLKTLATLRHRRARILPVLIAISLLMLWQVAHWSRQQAMVDLERSARHQLNLYIAHLKGQLEKYEFLPELLATNKRLVNLLERPEDRERIESLNRYLHSIAEIAGASDIYLMDAEGLTIAASNWLSERPFVGRNFSYRPYFQEAMEGRLGRYFALGTTSNKRGYYFAYPVSHDRDGRILGAVVTKINMAPLEERWSQSDNHFVVTDPDGVIFITTHKAWRFMSLKPLAAEVKQRIRDSRRYADATLSNVAFESVQARSADASVVSLKTPARNDYLLLGESMPEAGWRVHIMSRLDPVHSQVTWSVLYAGILLIVAALLVLYLVQRSTRLRERARFERQAKKNLEWRVKERTRDLTETNIRLTAEIEERRRTEEALRQAQDELIQAAKMAALGQMSAGINHELNQPLAAIRSYADNARALLDRERPTDAAWNLEQISELTDRMAKISSQLKVFARKTSGQPVPVSLSAVVDNSLKILAPSIRDGGTDIRLQLPQPECYLLADMVQLEQVFINLIGNALHAVETVDRRFIEISAEPLDDGVCISIRDSGPGIDPGHIDRIFDPFFTTKDEQLGLGLGLSISFRIIEGMNGTLSAENHPEGGAIFLLKMPGAEAPEIVTEEAV